MRKYENVPINQLIPYEKNARTHSEEQIERIIKSLKEFGFVNPVLVDQNYGVIAGHGRILAAKKIGLTEVPCIFVEDLTEEQKRAYIIADNKLALDAGWDFEILKTELEDLEKLNFDISLTGFDIDELDFSTGNENSEVIDDEVPDIPKETKIKTGDIYQLGNHRLMCGDSTDFDNMKILMNGKKADLCVTDPPYNCSYVGKTEAAMTITNDNMESEKFYNFLLMAFKNIYANLADGGAFYCFHSDAEKVNFFNATVESGFHYSTTCIWVKDSLVLGRMDYQMRHEPVIYAFKDTAKHNWYSDRKQTTVWEFARPKKSELHPTMKSLDLIAYPIKNSSRKGSLILDAFGGSGSTLMTCEQLERTCYMMELDPKYCDVIVERWENFTGEKAVKIWGN